MDYLLEEYKLYGSKKLINEEVNYMKFLAWFDDIEEKLMSVSLWAIVIIMGIQVIMRYVFSSSLQWSEEISRYFFIWFAFLGMSYAVKKGSHMRIDILEYNLPKLKKPIEILGDLFFMIFAIYMLIHGSKVIIFLKDSGQSSPAMGLPMYLVYLSLLIGFALVICRIVQKYVLRFKQQKSS